MPASIRDVASRLAWNESLHERYRESPGRQAARARPTRRCGGPHQSLLRAARPSQRSQQVAFGTSGHRGSALLRSFNEAHILAIAQALCLYRREQGIDGPLFLGIDTHALSRNAFETVLEVFAANGVATIIDEKLGFTPTPVISHAIIAHNRGRTAGLADGVVISPSHNPPADGGLKYNPRMAGRPIPTRPAGSRSAPTPSSPTSSPGSCACPTTRR